MSYDLDHEIIYQTTIKAAVLDGDIVCGAQKITISKETCGCFMVGVADEGDILDPPSYTVTTITREMLNAMVAALDDLNQSTTVSR